MKRWHLMIVLALAGGPATAADVRFDRDVQPLLARCAPCHGPGKARGGLRLDSLKGATAELDSGAGAAEPAKRMPPKGEPLTAAQVETLRQWIAAGAEWPPHWAYRPLTKPPL